MKISASSLKSKVYNFLKRTEKYTRTDNVYLVKGGFWLTFKQIGGFVIAWVLAMVWARFVPKEIYGKYKFIMSVAGFLAIFSLPGMNTALIRAVARGFEKTVKQIVKTKFRWSILSLGAGISLALYYWFQHNQILAISFLIVGIFSPLVNSFAVYGDYLAGKKRFDLQTKYGLLKNLLLASAMIVGILLTKNVIYLILIYFLSQTILTIFFYLFIFKKLPPKGEIDQKSITYGKHLSLSFVLGEIATYIDKVLVFHFLGATELAIYSFATLVPNQIRGLNKTFGKLALPKFSIRDTKEIKRNLWSKIIRMELFLIITVGLYIISAGLIFKLFFPAYLDSVLYSKIYSLSLLNGIVILPQNIVFAKAKTRVIYKYSLFNNSIQILTIFISLYYFGLLGLIVGNIIYKTIITGASFFMLREI